MSEENDKVFGPANGFNKRLNELYSQVQVTEAEIRHFKEIVAHLKELITQHDKLTELAITKSEASTNERFAKANEFREQQKDIIATFARQKEVDAALDAMVARFEQNLKSVSEKFLASDKQIQIVVDANAEVSNNGIKGLEERINALNIRNENFDGKLAVINRIVGILIGVGMVVLSAYIYSLFK